MKENDAGSGVGTSPKTVHVTNILHKIYSKIHMLCEIFYFVFLLMFSLIILNNIYYKFLFKQYFLDLDFVSYDMGKMLSSNLKS